jgi:GNAT superfamily N-acetyltransferase
MKLNLSPLSLNHSIKPMPLKRKTALSIRELTTQKEWLSMHALIRQLNKDLNKKQFETVLIEMLDKGYRCVGAYEENTLIGVMGFWVGYRFWCGKYIDIDNAIIDKHSRSRGIGKKLLAWIEKEGRRLSCDMAVLDSYTTSAQAHRFYFREGYCILGYHFTKHL